MSRESYFKETGPSEWSLVGFLKWKSQPSDVLQMSIEYSAWKKLVENIADTSHLYNDSVSQRAQIGIFILSIYCVLTRAQRTMKSIMELQENPEAYSNPKKFLPLPLPFLGERKPLTSYAHSQEVSNGVKLQTNYKQENKVREMHLYARRQIKFSRPKNDSEKSSSEFEFPFSSLKMKKLLLILPTLKGVASRTDK
ncbi:hypothetical protein C1645_836115 [Glomus cerebriforme]|uniref:Uncharacterized protein n=1 Tax=Glomus cerebriforme TaxID=658196 RepID=A0A397S900_9GLOM|nr:hypothetical protein C1645_836115 [Glomus cerebriforme]